MVPAAVVDETIAKVLPSLEPGNILIDGGNSYYMVQGACRHRAREQRPGFAGPQLVSRNRPPFSVISDEDPGPRLSKFRQGPALVV